MNGNLLRTLWTDITDSGLRGQLVRSTAATGIVKFGSLGLAFIASLLYARTLGPSEYGAYAYVLAWAALLTIPGSLGLPQYLVREGAKVPTSWKPLLHWADRRVLMAGVTCGCMMAILSLLPGESGVSTLMLIAAPLPLFNALAGVRSGLLQAHSRIIASQWPSLLLSPVLTLLVLVALWLMSGELSAKSLVLVTTAVAFVPVLAGSLQLSSTPAAAAATRASTQVRSALPFMWLNALFLINNRTDLIMVGALRGAHDAGTYSVAARAAELVQFFLIVSNATIGPRIAAMHHSGEHQRLQRLITGTAQRLLLITLPIACVMVVGAPYLIELFYGPTFAGATIVLQVLAIGQLVTVLGGPVGILLNMTEYATLSARAFATSALVNILLNACLVPKFGGAGAAASTAISLFLCTLIRWHAVRHHLKIRPTALGI